MRESAWRAPCASLVAVLLIATSCSAGGSVEGQVESPTPAPTPLEPPARPTPIELPDPEPEFGYIWKPIAIGAGGWIVGIEMSADGKLLIARTDTAGAWKWDDTWQRWRQVVTIDSVPPEFVNSQAGAGVHDLAIAPSDSGRVYMLMDGTLFRSDDAAETWQPTSLDGVAHSLLGDEGRSWGGRLAVDPLDPDIVIFGNPNKGDLYITRNGGETWLDTGLTSTSDLGFSAIAFDPSRGTTLTGTTAAMYANMNGTGFFESIDGGATWRRVEGGPRTVRNAIVTSDGALLAAEDWRSASGRKGKLYLLEDSRWRDVTPRAEGGDRPHGIAVHPTDPTRIVVASQNTRLFYSSDAGRTWTAADPGGSFDSSDDIPWLDAAEGALTGPAIGDIVFDVDNPDRLFRSGGTGVRWADIGDDPSQVEWVSLSLGIEQLVGNEIIQPPNSTRLLLASWDRPVWVRSTDDLGTFPNQHQPVDDPLPFNMAWDLDWSHADSDYVVGNINYEAQPMQSGFSSDGGDTWEVFENMPQGSRRATQWGYGAMAVSTPGNIVWIPSGKKQPYVTFDHGESWTPTSGLPYRDGELYLAGGMWRHNLAADRSADGTFYAYHPSEGVFSSTDGGARWVKVHDRLFRPQMGMFNLLLKSVPAHQGHLFLTTGQAGSGDGLIDEDATFLRSTDGGRTWSPLAGVREVHTYAFGKSAPGSDYPTIYIVGWVNGAYGIWRSTDEGASWSLIGEYPLHYLEHIRGSIDADKSEFGVVYVIFGGSGFAFGRPSGPATDPVIGIESP
jgi:photosystem II stability/assembly factor-like uncharacterized protein